MENLKPIIEIINIDGEVIWSNKSKESFVDFAKGIYEENELTGATELEDIPKAIKSKEDAIYYIETYTELYLYGKNEDSINQLKSL